MKLLALLVALTPGLALAQRAALTGVVTGAAGKPAAVWLERVPASAWAVPKEVPVLSQRGARFRPELLVVAAGQSVKMPNDDRMVHNVFSVSPAKKFDLGHYPQGESRVVRFDTPGVVEIFCNIHENMHATIIVAPSTFYAVSDGNGRFTIADVPVGSYKLVAWSYGGTTSTNVTIGASGGAATLALARP